MRRNCGKLVTFVGTFPTSSSIACKLCSSCGFAKNFGNSSYVSSAINGAGSNSNGQQHNCQCLSSSIVNEFGNSSINAKSAQCSTSYWRPQSMQNLSRHVSSNLNANYSAGMSKPSPLSSFLHLRKCSTIPGTATSLYTSKRNYSSKKNAEDFAGVRTVMNTSLSSSSSHHCDNRNHLQDKSSAQSSSFDENNTQTRWSIDYCSTIPNKNKENCSISSSSVTLPSSVSSPQSSAVGARSPISCGNSISVGTNGSSSPSTSSVAATTASVFGMMTATGGTPAAVTSTFTSVRTVVTSQRLVEVTRDNIMEQPKLMSKEEREEFMSVYHQLVKELLDIPDMKDMEETNRWMARVLQYNVPHGKRNRGLSTALAYKYFAPEELTEENVRLSYVLGWCVEILQAFFLVADDIMDESETRRGRPCWYKVDNLGLAAVNDALLLESTIYAILRKHFSDKPFYGKVMEVMHDVTYKTIFGQSLDTRTGQDRRMETYTMDRYSSIVKYKTSYYSFYLPVALAMSMCEITDPNLFQQMRKVTLEMGHFFQVQDDYLDCFGDEEVTGKIGTDIQDCKCSWMFVVATQMCSPEQKKFLMDNYGKHNPENIAAVKKLYKELGMEDVYHNYEEQTYNMICTHIQQMSDQMPKGLFYDMLHKIYKRSS